MTIKWMLCTTCKNMVYPNDTQVCLSCQRGFMGIPQEDDCTNYTIALLEAKRREVEDAIQEQEPEGLFICEQSGGSQRVCSTHAERREAPKEGRKEAKKEEIMGSKIAKQFIPQARGGGR